MRNRKSGRIIQSTKTSLDIVDVLIETEGARLTEITNNLDISKSTVYHHLYTLQNAGYVVMLGDEYYPSLKFAYVGEVARRRDPSFEIATEVTQELNEKTSFQTSFIIEENGLARFLTPEVDHPERFDKFAFVGKESYLHTMAAGKAILSSLPDKTVERIIDQIGLPEVTNESITTRDELYTELEHIQKKGFAVNKGESRPDIYVVGMSVMKPDGTVLGAMSVGSPLNRIEEDEFTVRIVDELNKHVDILEDRLQNQKSWSRRKVL